MLFLVTEISTVAYYLRYLAAVICKLIYWLIAWLFQA